LAPTWPTSCTNTSAPGHEAPPSQSLPPVCIRLLSAAQPPCCPHAALCFLLLPPLLSASSCCPPTALCFLLLPPRCRVCPPAAPTLSSYCPLAAPTLPLLPLLPAPRSRAALLVAPTLPFAASCCP
jgi:hypothetical protein